MRYFEATLDGPFPHAVFASSPPLPLPPPHRSKMDAFEAEEGALLGSLLLEPLVMGAGGMVFVDPLFQRVLVQVRGKANFLVQSRSCSPQS